MIDTPKDLVWDLPCVQQGNYLEGGSLMSLQVKWLFKLGEVEIKGVDYT